MSCNRQNFRPMGNQCGTNCVTPTGFVQSGTSAGCGASCPTVQLEELPLGMAYVPWQTFGTMYPMQQGMRRGTMFPCLDFDFMGRRCN